MRENYNSRTCCQLVPKAWSAFWTSKLHVLLAWLKNSCQQCKIPCGSGRISEIQVIGNNTIRCNMQTFQKLRNIPQTCLRELVTRHSSLITLITSPDHVWIAQTLTPTHVSTVLRYSHPEKFDYLHYLHHNNLLLHILLTKEIENPENWELTTENWDPMIT